jgi:uncharacterized phage protein (TIGR01671 family)
MNREIKFRAWDSRWKRIFYSDNQDDAKFLGAKLGGSLIATFFNHFYGDKTVGQFTGLKDKNGKEIYEGDLIRWGLGFTGSYDKEHWHRYAVVEINPDIQFRIIYYETSIGLEKMPTDNYVFRYGKFAYKETDLYIEIIGNIHENPELL